MKSAWMNGLSLLILAIVPSLLWGGEQRASDEAQLKAAGLASDGPALLRFFQQHTPDRSRASADGDPGATSGQ